MTCHCLLRRGLRAKPVRTTAEHPTDSAEEPDFFPPELRSRSMMKRTRSHRRIAQRFSVRLSFVVFGMGAAFRNLDAELTRLDKPHQFYTYPAADHAFMDYTGQKYNKEASEMSWPRTLDFFSVHLANPE